MIESHHIEEFKIKTYDTDFKHRLRIEALFNYFQEVAEIHSNHGNVGYIGMQRRNMIWILSKVRVHINALPKVNESIQIKTWSRGVDRLFAYRDFSVTNGNNKNIINASSAWLIIDKIKHRPIRPEIFADGFPTKNQQSDKFCFNKIPPLTKTDETKKREIYYTDIDINQHVNNARYISWIPDAAGTNKMKDEIKHIQIDYLKETKEKDIISFSKQIIDSQYLYCIKHQDGSDAVRARITWK